MSRAPWITLAASVTFTSTLVYLVHRQQRVEKEAMRAGIVKENAERQKLANERIERNRIDHEIQLKLAEELNNKWHDPLLLSAKMNAIAAHSMPSQLLPQLTSQFSQLSFNPTLLKDSSLKVLQKTLLLAAKLEQKRGKIVDFWHRRRLLLLTALALISRGCGLGTKLLQIDELIDWLSGPLCKVSIKVAMAALNGGVSGLNTLVHDVCLAERLRVLHALKQRHRKSKPSVSLQSSCSSLQPYLALLDQKRAFLAAQKQKLAAQQQLQFATQVAAQKFKNAQLSAHLASLQDGSKAALLAPFLHAWRCLLNFRLVRARTRRRFKAAILTRWRRSGRVSRIAGIFYGKKVKLRVMNRWFSKRFGRNREQALTTKLNEFIARKRRRAMFTFTTNPYDCSEKALLRTWRNQFRFRIAASKHARRLARQTLTRMQQFSLVGKGRTQTARLYNEIRLLKNAFYSWFNAAVPDRLLFARANQFTSAHKKSLKFGGLSQWARKLASLQRLQLESDRQTHLQELKTQLFSLSKWRLLAKQHSARLIWTSNFRATEDLRAAWQVWLQRTRMQIHSDTIYQRGLALSSLQQWRTLFSVRQERRWSLFRGLKRWRHAHRARQATIFFAGQRMLRVLNANDAPSSTLAHALSRPPQQQRQLTFVYQWRSALTRLIGLELAGDGMILESLKGRLKRWRLQTHLRRLPVAAPIKLATKMIRRLKRFLQRRQERSDELESALLHFYTQRAWKLEASAFGKWERLFQVAQLGKVACDAELKAWQAKEKWHCLHRWQLQTALKIHQKCGKWTGRQRVLNYWRGVGKALQAQRRLRILGRSLRNWSAALKERRLMSLQLTAWRCFKTAHAIERWRSMLFAQQSTNSLATDFCFLASGLAALRGWKQALLSKRQRSKPQIVRSLRAPAAHLLKPKKIEVPLLDLEEADQSNELTVAELSV